MNQDFNMPNMQPAPFMNQAQNNMPEQNDLMNSRLTYPEIYYKCLPFVMAACDQMDASTNGMPTQEMVEMMTDNIYDEMIRMYPDLTDYAGSGEQNFEADIPVQNFQSFDRNRNRRRFRRRGAFRDFIEFLLLSELFRRRRRAY